MSLQRCVRRRAAGRVQRHGQRAGRRLLEPGARVATVRARALGTHGRGAGLLVIMLALVGCTSGLREALPPPGDHRLVKFEGADLAARPWETLDRPPADLMTEVVAAEPWWVLEAAVIESPEGFNEVLPSWNLDVAAGAGARVDLRVATRGDDGELAWSPWLYAGRWGERVVPGRRVIDFSLPGVRGRMEVDYLSADGPLHAAQLRVVGVSPPGAAETGAGEAGAKAAAPVGVARLAMLLSRVPEAGAARADRATADGGPMSAGAGAGVHDGAGAFWPPGRRPGRLGVPFRSQMTGDQRLDGRLCSPTSVTMVLAYRGVDRPLADVAAAAFDADHDLYGNWPNNVQTAYSLGAAARGVGVPGYVTRIGSWGEALRYLDAGQPLIISIQTRPGELTNAPYRQTGGHLIVLEGVDARGDLLVNDPAVSTPEAGRLTYARRELTRVWLQRVQGTAYVLGPAGPATPVLRLRELDP